MKKIISIALLAILLVSSLASCNVKYHSNNPETALTVGGHEISYDMFTYFFMSYKLAAGNEDKSEEEILEQTLGTLREIVAIEDMAEKYDLGPTEESLELLKLEMEAMRDSYPDTETMISELAKDYVSQQVYYDIYYHVELESVVSAYLAEEANMIIISSDKVVEAAVKDTFMASVNIVIYPDTEKDGLRGEELAKALHARILAGEDIEALAEEYSDHQNKGMIVFAPLTMQENYESKVKSLKVGELSDVYTADYGYYITKRVDITDDYISENFDDLRDEYKYSEYLKIMTELTATYEVVYAEGFDLSTIGK